MLAVNRLNTLFIPIMKPMKQRNLVGTVPPLLITYMAPTCY